VERKAVEVPLNYPTTMIYLDESRARAAGGRFFSIAALKIREHGALSRGLLDIRDRRRFNGEFKFKSLTTGALPRYKEAIGLLEDSDAVIHACVVDCEKYDPFSGPKEFWEVHADIVTQLLVAAINKVELVTVLLDRIPTPREIAYEDLIKERVNKRLGSTNIVGAACLDSQCSDVLQLTDLVAGAIAYDRGLQADTYRSGKGLEKKKLIVHLKAALGGVDFNDGRTSRLNIATWREPTKKKTPKPALALVSGEKAG
jgi:hypothetical protein